MTLPGRRGRRVRAVRGLSILALCLAASMGLGGGVTAKEANGPVIDLPAWFTAEQAARGQSVFLIECAGCHGLEVASAVLRHPTLELFFGYVSEAMPYDGSPLGTGQYVDVVAFLLRELGFPAGDDALTAERELLNRLRPASSFLPQQEDPGSAEVTNDTPGGDIAGMQAWFSADQASRGASTFAVSCGGCHGPEMVNVFANYANAGAYYAFASAVMPEDSPGSLPPQNYADIIAYLMHELGFPSGDDILPPDPAVLGRIVPAQAAN